MAIEYLTAKGIAKGALALGVLGGGGVAYNSVGNSADTLPVGCSMAVDVENNDSWSGIASQYGMSADELAILNDTTIQETIHPKDKVCVVIGEPALNNTVSVDNGNSGSELIRDGSNCLPGTDIYTVESGDSAYSVANHFGTDLQTVYGMNPGLEVATIHPGDKLCALTDLNEEDFSGYEAEIRLPIADASVNEEPECRVSTDINKDGSVNNADVKAFQKDYNIRFDPDIYVDGKVGPQTSQAIRHYQGVLGVYVDCDWGNISENASNNTQYISNDEFSPAEDCPTKYSCELIYDLSDKTGKILENDGVYSTAIGAELYSFPIVPGGADNPTNTGHFTLGPVEYGEDGNPWRLSTITAENNPNAEPNLYKFRRHNPVDGTYSGEGTHGTRTFYGASAGCGRTRPEDQDVIAQLQTGTQIIIQN